MSGTSKLLPSSSRLNVSITMCIINVGCDPIFEINKRFQNGTTIFMVDFDKLQTMLS